MRDLSGLPAPARAAALGAGALVAWGIAALVLPNGLPTGVVLLGTVLGSLTGLTAMGLVLIHRATRIINFAQVEIGGFAATVTLIAVIGWGWPYMLAVPVGLAVAVATGALIDIAVVKRFAQAPRLILTVATIGILQILGAAQLAIPNVFADLRPLETFKGPLRTSFGVGPVVFHGDSVIALVAVPLALAGLGWFLSRSDTGIAVRASADSSERALLLGIPVRRLSTITWMVAAGLSGVAAILSAPIRGASLGVIGGPPLLLAPLAAAVIARMESLPVALGASIGIGIAQQGVFWNYPRSSTVDVVLFAVILVALLLQRRRSARTDDAGLGGYVAVREVRPVPAALRGLREVRIARVGVPGVVAAVAIVLPLVVTPARTILLTHTVLYAIIAVSLVLLTGWAGQISFGQFAFVGIGAAITGSLMVHANLDLFLAILIAGIAGGAAALLVGIPALRIQGLYLAVTTLAFAVPVSTFLLNSGYFPTLNPRRVAPPVLFGRMPLESFRTLYYVSLVFLAGTIVLAWNVRRSRAGRAVIAVRDNDRAAAAHAISPTRLKLFAFALAGAIAGAAGGLYVVVNRGIPFSGFNPILSVEVFTAVVVGGLGSLSGALLGAGYVQAVQYFLPPAGQLLATGAGLLVLLMVLPGGLGELLYALRERALRRLAGVKGIELPAPAAAGSAASVRPVVTEVSDGLLVCDGIEAGYGSLQVLFGVDLGVARGEVATLLGTNGAGKSTVLRVASGVLRATRGRVLFDGADVTAMDPVDRVRAGLVAVPGGRGVFPSLTVAENLRVAAWLRRKEAVDLEEVYGLFPVLRERAAQRASELSGGEQQMLTLAQALLCRPKLLMIDELSLGLAPAVVTRLAGVVRELNERGITVLIVEQSLNVAASLAPRAVFMEKGQVRFVGATQELLDRPDLARAVFFRDGSKRRRAAALAPAGDGVLLSTSGLTKRFGGILAVDDVEIEVRRGEILGIIGPNGAGKTTLVDLCSGSIAPDGGRVVLDDRDVTGWDAASLAETGVGRTFQDAKLWPSMTVAEALATALDRHADVRDPFLCAVRPWAVVHSEREIAARVDELLASQGLEGYRDTFVGELSTGTRRVLEIACALAHGPDLLFLDEPSAGVAQREGEALGALLVDLRDRTGATLVVVEHNIPLISSIADRLVCMDVGRVLVSGIPRTVLSDARVLECYLGTEAGAFAPPAARGNGRRARRRAASR